MLAGGLYERTSGAAGQPLGGYQRRANERTVLHELVARHAQSMLAELRDADPDGRGLPRSQTAGPASRARRLPWADLLRRVFADDVLQCPCGGRGSVVAIVTDSALARALLAGFGLATEPSTFAPARAPPQADFPWDDAL